MDDKVMMAATLPVRISLTEWQKLSPDAVRKAVGEVSLNETSSLLCDKLAQSGFVEILELKSGISIQTYSYVGNLSLGNFELQIIPKIERMPLLALFRYGYGFSDLHLFGKHLLRLADYALQDILIVQLIGEVRSLLRRGLFQRYVKERKELSSLRGRIDIGALAKKGGVPSSRLPCILNPRSFNVHHNQLIRAGLAHASHITTDNQLRFDCNRLSGIMGEKISTVPLTKAKALYSQTLREVNRLNSYYEPSFNLIRVLMESRGAFLDGEENRVSVPGFLFDMNRLFQAVLSRFLNENLQQHTVLDEHSLKGMLAYAPEYNPKNRKAPLPRPDFIVQEDGRTVAVLDAKYRDLWENNLPREMLYQLGMYALAHSDIKKATILYPTVTSSAKESRIEIADPTSGAKVGNVQLRPVHVPELVRLIELPNSASLKREKHSLAHYLVFGNN